VNRELARFLILKAREENEPERWMRMTSAPALARERAMLAPIPRVPPLINERKEEREAEVGREEGRGGRRSALRSRVPFVGEL